MQQRRGAQVGQRAHLIEHRVADVVTVRVTAARDAIVRARFDRTVWDSNGDSRMKTIVGSDCYQTFFRAMDKAMRTTSCER